MEVNLYWILAALVGQRRSFRIDAQRAVAKLKPPLHVIGEEYIPHSGPCLVTVNHYTRPGFGAWWLALCISSLVPVEMHWTMAGAWTYPDSFRQRLLTPMSQWIFRRIAEMYGFTTMPPMPPRPQDVAARAQAVRSILSYVRQSPQAIIGLAPEGRDIPGGGLGDPPPGAGRFIEHLCKLGMHIVPVGAYETEGCFCLRFGSAYSLDVQANQNAAQRDAFTSQAVMSRIAALIPTNQ